MQSHATQWKSSLFNDRYNLDINAFKKWDKRFIRPDHLARDIPRVRKDVDYLQQQRTLQELELLVVFFCLQNKLNYQQGMLDLAIPFIMLRTQGFRLSTCYGLFNGFMKKNKNLYLQKQVIQFRNDRFKTKIELPYNMASLYFLKVLISYHLPHLIPLFITEHINMLSVWIMTLFSQRTDIIQVMILFDRYIKYNNPIFILYLCMAKLMQSQAAIASFLEDPEEFLPFISSDLLKIDFVSEKAIDDWFALAQGIRNNTPESFEYLIDNSEYNKFSILSQQNLAFLLDALQKEDCQMYMLPIEIAKHFKQESRIKNMILVDCRKVKAIYFRSFQSLSFLRANENYHYVLIMNAHQNVDSVKRLFQSEYQLKYISILQGGFENLLPYLKQEKVELEKGTIFSKIKWILLDLFGFTNFFGQNKN